MCEEAKASSREALEGKTLLQSRRSRTGDRQRAKETPERGVERKGTSSFLLSTMANAAPIAMKEVLLVSSPETQPKPVCVCVRRYALLGASLVYLRDSVGEREKIES